LERAGELAQRALRDEPTPREDALWILDGDDVELLPLLQAAYEPRRRHFGRGVMVHVLNNACVPRTVATAPSLATRRPRSASTP
jgi:hypothetical protein